MAPVPDEPQAGETYLQVTAVARAEAEIFVDVLGKKGFHALFTPVPNDNSGLYAFWWARSKTRAGSHKHVPICRRPGSRASTPSCENTDLQDSLVQISPPAPAQPRLPEWLRKAERISNRSKRLRPTCAG